MKFSPCEINKHNKLLNSNRLLPSVLILGFYHIFCGPNDWVGIVKEQISMIKTSGLSMYLSKLYVTIIGNEKDISVAKVLLAGINCEIIYGSEDGQCFEFPSLKKMVDISENNEFYALYFHTKGASYSKPNNHDNFEWKRVQAARWRMLMNYFCIYYI